MSALTPERLAGIRERLDLYGGLDPLDTSDLLAEVERLRAGIAEAQHVRHLGSDCAACDMRGVLHALLNPTEGETDDR